MDKLVNINGNRYCEFNQSEWEEHKTEIRVISENNKRCAEILERINDDMLKVLMGREIVPADIARNLLSEQRDAYKMVIKSLSWCFGIIIIVLLGVKYLAPHLFGGG